EERDWLDASLRQGGRTLDALLEKEARERTLLEHIDEAVYLVDHVNEPPRRQLAFLSDRIERLFGYTADQLHDNSLWETMVHPEDMQALRERTKVILASGQPGNREYRIRHGRTDEFRWVEDHLVPYAGASGVVTQVFGVMRDITERKRAEE